MGPQVSVDAPVSTLAGGIECPGYRVVFGTDYLAVRLCGSSNAGCWEGR